MSVPSVITDLNTTASSNSPAGTDAVGTTMDDFIRAHAAIIRQETAGAYSDVASATTTDIGAVASTNVRITGTTTITGLGTVSAGIVRNVRFAGALTLTHNGTSLILPGSANITTAADDTATFRSLGSGNWICTSYKFASGGVKGTATNDSAATGFVGERLSSDITFGSAVSLTTITAANMTSLSLTAGDWEVSADFFFTGGATSTVTYLEGSISSTTATRNTANSAFSVQPYRAATIFADSSAHLKAGPYRISIASTTTIYAVAVASFGVSTCSVYGNLRAIRVR